MSTAETRSDARRHAPPFAAIAAVWLCAVAMSGAAMGTEPRDPVTAAFATGGGDGFRLSLSRDGGTVLLRASANDGVSSLSVVCALCTHDELLVAARSLGAQLAAREASRDPCRLEVGGLPDGAAVQVDGVPGRVDGAPMLVEPGRHEVRAFGGGTLRTGAIAVDPGEDGRLEWSDMKTISPRRVTLRVAIASGGLGLALAAAGTAFLLLDGDCATAPDATGRCDKLHHLAPLGWSFVGTGAAAVLFGVVYGIASSRAESPSPGATEVAR
jgi:hypothetical protein